MNKVYIHYGADHYDQNKFKPITGSHPVNNKPEGGFWASPVDTKWSWKNWCESEEFHTERLNKSFKFTLVNGSKVFHIRNHNDIFKLPMLKEMELYNGKLNLLLGWYYDWKKIASKYDAVELHLSNDYMLFHDAFYCWDVDSIVILKPNIVREVEE